MGSGTTSLVNTILAGNTAATSPDCFGSPTSLGNNLIGNNSARSYSSASGDRVGSFSTPKDPLLGVLQDNGGPTLTDELLSGSEAIDNGNDSAAPATDQRGVSRPQETASDIGAFELSTTNAELSITKTDSPHWVRVGATLIYTLTATNDGTTTATGVTVTDVLPSDNVSLVSTTPSQGVCSGTTTVSCSLGTLGAGQSAIVTIEVTVTSANGSTNMISVTNTASVSANESDLDLADNTARQATFILGVNAVPSVSVWGMMALATLLVVAIGWRMARTGRREQT